MSIASVILLVNSLYPFRVTIISKQLVTEVKDVLREVEDR